MVLGLGQPDVAQALDNRADVTDTLCATVSQGKYAEAEPLYERWQAIFETALGPEHPNVATALNNRAGLLEDQRRQTNFSPPLPVTFQGKYEEAEPLYMLSLAIDEKVYGPDHLEVAEDLNNCAGLLSIEGKYTEAEPLYERCQAIFETVLGPEHPDLATALNNRARLLESQALNKRVGVEGKCLCLFATSYRPHFVWLNYEYICQGNYAEAKPLYERSQAIRKKVLGPDHPDVATVLNNRAGLLKILLSLENPGVAQALHNSTGVS
ncbi:unnamed protein product [Ectocarpus sp. CCAP 1310/34]|nr:unnamed protein product [Ectocarpus sp. CCAP 1310/34]